MTDQPAPKRRKRRARRPDQPMPPAALWKRALAAVLFTLGGGGFALWGGFALFGWIGTLNAAPPLMETDSAVLGLIPLGAGIGAMGPLFFMTEAKTPAGKRWQERLGIGLLGTCGIGIVLVAVGGLVVDEVMDSHGYRVCDVSYGRRVTFKDWAARGVPCPPDDDAG